MANERLLVASADGHVGLPMPRWREYLESDLHEAFDDFLRTHRNRWTPGHADSVLTSEAFAWQTGNDRYAGYPSAAILWDYCGTRRRDHRYI